MRISTTFSEIDAICDYIPIISTISNLADLFEKCVCQFLPKGSLKNRYWTHITEKDIFRSFFLLIPVIGNIYVLLDDYFTYKKNENEYQRALNLVANRISNSIESLRSPRPKVETGQAPEKEQRRLWYACLFNTTKSMAKVQKLLNTEKISPSFSHFGFSPLFMACQFSSLRVIENLLLSKADPNDLSILGISSFALACARGDLEIVTFLYPYIKDINRPEIQDCTPLMFAASKGHKDVVRFLIEKGANPLLQTSLQTDALFYAIAGDHVELLPLLFSENELVDSRKYTIAQTISVRSRIKETYTPLCFAVAVGAKKSALFLLEKGADPFIALRRMKKTAFDLACQQGLVKVIEWIENHYRNKISSEIEKRLFSIHSKANPSAQREFRLSIQRLMPYFPLEQPLNNFENSRKQIETELALGPLPRTGMELIFGRIDSFQEEILL